MADKIIHLRIFPDSDGKMNTSLADMGGEMLIISQFTLHGDCRKGRRPGFSAAAPPQIAEPLYNQFIEEVRERGVPVATGIFQAEMAVDLVNDGPVTLLLDSEKTF
jgi:D-tyrosyl-tRNA(Tyr) deacylase